MKRFAYLALVPIVFSACEVSTLDPVAPTPGEPSFAHAGPSVPADNISTDAVRKALNRFQNVELAEKSGYLRPGGDAEPCVQGPLGIMGFHYVNESLRSDPDLHPMRPDVLVYLPDGNGGMRLVAVEYFTWVEDWEAEHGEDADPPSMFGQEFIYGTHGIPPHYELHAWLWAENPSGMFENWNTDPTLSCG